MSLLDKVMAMSPDEYQRARSRIDNRNANMDIVIDKIGNVPLFIPDLRSLTDESDWFPDEYLLAEQLIFQYGR